MAPCQLHAMDIGKRFGEFVALQDVSIAVEQGEFLTLLRAVRLGQDDPVDDSGRFLDAQHRAVAAISVVLIVLTIGIVLIRAIVQGKR